ncbi:MAG: hypothetical protein KGO50_02360 [Myxococcales bacterium]|nr:hypothetical protein [Myxococcales bacterium]
MTDGLRTRPRRIGSLLTDPTIAITSAARHPIRLCLATPADPEGARVWLVARPLGDGRFFVAAMTFADPHNLRASLIEPALGASDVERFRAVVESGVGRLLEAPVSELTAALQNVRSGSGVHPSHPGLLRSLCSE